MNDDPATELRRILIENHGIRSAKVTPEARIVNDLGIDGDDVAELLDDLASRFGTDFSALNDQWREFFNTEGASLRAIILGMLSAIVFGGVTGVLLAYLGWFGIVLSVILFVSGARVFGRRYGRKLRPLTIAGLTEIVVAGRWPSDPSDVR